MFFSVWRLESFILVIAQCSQYRHRIFHTSPHMGRALLHVGRLWTQIITRQAASYNQPFDLSPDVAPLAQNWRGVAESGLNKYQ